MSVVLVDHPAPHVTQVTLHRPEVLNAMSIELVLELAEQLQAIGADNDCRVVVLTGAGRAFCSGLDLKDHGVLPGIDGLSMGRIAQRSMAAYSQIVPILRRLPQPVIAAVNGPAYGGGMCLALGADLRFASTDVELNATGIVNGLTSTEMGASWLLPRSVGAAHSNDLLRTGRVIGADEAWRMGLVSRVLAPEDLVPAAVEAASAMARHSPYGLSMTKDVLWANLETSSLEAAIQLEDRNQLMLGFTENLPEAMRAFAQGRQPAYTDDPRRDLFG
ncbi:enoyl-CoA hydratase [soil metagenome]